MEYFLWVLLALFAYSIVAPITSIVMRDVPPAPALFIATVVFLVLMTGVLVLSGTADSSHLFTAEAGYVYVAGLFLTIGILAYTFALDGGPVSIVVPVFGMFIVGSSVIGIVFLDETFTVPRAAGIGCAVIAVYLSAGDGQ